MEMVEARQARQTNDMRRHNDKKGPIDAPLAELDPSTIQIDGSYIVGKGTVEIDGVHYEITINPTSVDWVALDAPEPTQEDIPDNVITETPVDDVAAETHESKTVEETPEPEAVAVVVRASSPIS